MSGTLVTFTCGWGRYGQLGHGDELDQLTPRAVDQQQLKTSLDTVACGLQYCLAASSKVCASWGYGRNSQLGQGSDRNYLAPQRIQTLNKITIVALAAGYEHSVALTKSGQVYSWGIGSSGYLGRGIESDQPTPQLVAPFDADPPGDPVVSIACGLRHTLVLTKEGRVYSWGSGSHGRLGHGNEDDQLLPMMIKYLSEKNHTADRIREIGCGWHYSMAQTSGGKLYSWGYAKDGALGLGAVSDCNLPREIDKFVQSKRRLGQVVPEATKATILSFSCGGKHVLAIADTGEVYSWGRGEFGRLGHGSEEARLFPSSIEALSGKKIIAVAAGGYHSVARNEKHVYVWGCGDNGRLGLNSTDDHLVPTKLRFFSDYRVEKIFAGAYVTVVIAGMPARASLPAEGKVVTAAARSSWLRCCIA